MPFKMKGFSPFDKDHTPTVGTVVGDVDNKVNDAYESGDMKALEKALTELNKDIETLKNQGKGEEINEYLNPANYASVGAYTATREKDNPQKEK
jgi:hypothetical protein